METKTNFISGISEIDFQKSSEAGRCVLERGPLAVSATYLEIENNIRVGLNNGCFFGFPVEKTEGLQGAKPADLMVIEITALGLGLYWPRLDVDLNVPALVAGVLGTRRWMAAIGTAGGAVKSEMKKHSSKENGKLGGRPKKVAALKVESA